MSVFTANEIAYLESQRLGRLATVDEAGELHVVPVGFHFNPTLNTIDLGGYSMGQTKKFRNVKRTGRAAFVVDDVLPPWQPRCIEVRGRAEALALGGKDLNENFDAAMIRITPERIVAWGIDGDAPSPNRRSVGHSDVGAPSP